jgi:diguanylate cyclase (GGDEF)-like protein
VHVAEIKGAVFLDLDRFKTLNDTLGHDIGDLLLKQVAVRLTDCVRAGDTIAHIGGDEFILLLEDLSPDAIDAAGQAESVSNKILHSISQQYQLGVNSYRSSASIGSVIFNGHDVSIDELLKQADIAMYQAKDSGRNTLRFFDPKMQEAINERVELENELRIAIEQKQFELYYQAQVDNSGRVIGAEALIRWRHPVRGIVPPFDFIPLAEETGIILPMGYWVLDAACAQLKLWQQSSHTRALTLAVNVSAKQCHQADFVDQVKELIAHYDIDPALLKLELTESTLLEDIEGIIAKMIILRKAGVKFELDDFGTGYSSLQYLKKLPLNQLKIDKSFISDIAIKGNGRTLVCTIIAMAHSLNLNVIAEGVETEEQQQFLKDNGCDHYQGYLFSKPVTIKAFEALFEPD